MSDKQEQTSTDIYFRVDAKRVRNVLAAAGTAQMSTLQAEAFLFIFHEQLEDALAQAMRNFVVAKMGNTSERS